MEQRRIDYRQLVASDLARIRDIDRSERIEAMYVQRGTRLEQQKGDFSSSGWLDGQGEHSFTEQQAHVESWIEKGGTTLGAFDGDRLVGIGVVVPHRRPGIAQLAYLHVSNGYRASGIGRQLSEQLDRIAVEDGASEIVVSATPSENTVRFYLSRGFEPMAEPLPELFELEPEDIHLHKPL